MINKKHFDVIIIGGSYSGLAAGMSLGRALLHVLIIDGGNPCNKQTPQSHNFLTQDGKTPAEIATIGKHQLQHYATIEYLTGQATTGRKTENGFEILLASGETFTADKLIFATGIADTMPDIRGFAESWGKSVLHCPYCHGYEVKNEKTGILGNGETGYELSKLISNWTNDLTLYTNGPSTLSAEQADKLKKHHIQICEKEVKGLDHISGYIQRILFRNGTTSPAKAIYARVPFEQHCRIPESLGCELTSDGYIKVDPSQETSVNGVFACGDNASRIRTVANAIAAGNTAGISASRKIIDETF